MRRHVSPEHIEAPGQGAQGKARVVPEPTETPTPWKEHAGGKALIGGEACPDMGQLRQNPNLMARDGQQEQKPRRRDARKSTSSG